MTYKCYKMTYKCYKMTGIGQQIDTTENASWYSGLQLYKYDECDFLIKT